MKPLNQGSKWPYSGGSFTGFVACAVQAAGQVAHPENVSRANAILM
jgi:hypothetical protein